MGHIDRHNAGAEPVNMTIVGLDGSNHSSVVGGSSSLALQAGDYNYTIASPAYALAWNGTIRLS